MEKWWIIKDVKPPVYVNLRVKRSYTLLALLVFILGIILGEASGLLPPGISVLVSTIVLIIEAIINIFTGIGKLKLGKTDILFIQNVLRSISTRIGKWSIPSRNIPVVATLSNGLYMVIYYHTNRLKLVLLKPIVYNRVLMGKPVIKIRKNNGIKKRVDSTTLWIGYANIIFPHPEIRNTNYYVTAKTIITEQYIPPDKISMLIEKFDNYFTGVTQWLKY